VTIPVRLPDVASFETVLAGLDPALAEALVPALTAAFPGFEFSLAPIDDDWPDIRSVIRPDGTRLGELRPWTHRVFAHWALDTHDTYQGEREIGFIPRPLRPPKERLRPMPDASVHLLMDRTEAADREIGLPFGWRFLMTHGHWVDPDVSLAIGQRAQRVRLPDRDAAVLLRWADQPYGFEERTGHGRH
jgi:hypothetical protein